MSERLAPEGYSRLQVVLHWTIATMVVFQLMVNEKVQEAFRDRTDGRDTSDDWGAFLHVAVGLTVLALALVRLAVRFRRGVPKSHATNPLVINLVGYLAHLLLYGFLIAMPVTGAIAWFTGLELSAELHELGRFVLIPLILLHAIGALAEHFVFRTNSLVRMLKAEAPKD